ncbi:hypothetical protein LTR95_002270 [Oleoguttula sp. CCFEE 5521]
MASSFNINLQRITELSGQNGIKDYASRLQDAKAARTCHAGKLGVLKKDVMKLSAELGTVSDVAGDIHPDTIMSDGEDNPQTEIAGGTTLDSSTTNTRTSTSFTASTPKIDARKFLTRIY